MTVLSHEAICEMVEAGEIILSPFDLKRVQPGSYDVTLGDHLKVGSYCPRSDQEEQTVWRDLKIGDAGYLMHPQSFLLGETAEHLTLSNGLQANLGGKSSLGRQGLFIHITAGIIDAGWSGVLTLELHNVGPAPITLKRNMPIGQLSFSFLDRRTNHPYRGQYMGAQGVESSKGAK